LGDFKVMNLLDAFIVIIIGINGRSGFNRGLIRIVCDVLAFIGGAIIGGIYAPNLSEIISRYTFIQYPFSTILGFILIWAVIFVIVGGIGKISHKVIKFSLFGPINKMGGLFFGLIRGGFVAVPFILPLIYFNIPMVDASALVRPFRPVLVKLSNQFLEKTHQFIDEPIKHKVKYEDIESLPELTREEF